MKKKGLLHFLIFNFKCIYLNTFFSCQSAYDLTGITRLSNTSSLPPLQRKYDFNELCLDFTTPQPRLSRTSNPNIANNLIYINSSLFREPQNNTIRSSLYDDSDNRLIITSQKAICYRPTESKKYATYGAAENENDSRSGNNIVNRGAQASSRRDFNPNASSIKDLESFNKKRFELETIL